MISTPTPAEYIEGDEEALETSFYSLEIVGTTGEELEQGGSKPSRATIMAARNLEAKLSVWALNSRGSGSKFGLSTRRPTSGLGFDWRWRTTCSPSEVCLWNGVLAKRLTWYLESWLVLSLQEMPTPKTELKVWGFLGRVNYIARFISQLTITCSPIFKLLCKNQKMDWDLDCQEAFEKIKKYLENSPVLVLAVLGKPLILYLTVLEESMGYILGQQDTIGKKEHVIYYLSKMFIDCETRYPTLERTYCALVLVAKRLRQYLLANTTWLISKIDTIKYTFEKPTLTGWIAN
ncbi:Retrovirus-related Pol polyprotein from transposon 17.6, partial [Mucuna pruriens]